MLATECQYCNVRSFLSCCLKIPLEKPLKVICEPCLRDLLQRTSGHIPCPICLSPSRSDDIRIQQILTREENLKKKISQVYHTKEGQNMASCNHIKGNSSLAKPQHLNQSYPSCLLQNQKEIKPLVQTTENPPLRKSIYQSCSNQSSHLYSPQPNQSKKKKVAFSIFDIPEQPSYKVTPEQIQAFNEALNAPLSDDARLAFERKKGGVDQKEPKRENIVKKKEGNNDLVSIAFSDTSTYRDLQL